MGAVLHWLLISKRRGLVATGSESRRLDKFNISRSRAYFMKCSGAIVFQMLTVGHGGKNAGQQSYRLQFHCPELAAWIDLLPAQ